MSPKKKKTTKAKTVAVKQPSIAFYRNIAVTFLLLTVILLVVVAYMSVKKVTVRILTQPQTIEINALARIGEKAEDMPHIAGAVERVEIEFEKSFEPTGTREKEARAAGKVTIINETNKNQPLVATTRLLSPSGILFRMKEGATAPAGGSVEVDVYADEEGKAGEVGPTKFTIPGLWEPLQKTIYAVSETAMTGGVRNVGVVSELDIDQAKNEVRSAILEKAKSDLRESHAAEESMGDVAVIESVVFDVDGNDEEEVSEFTIKAKALVVIGLYNKQEVMQLANARLKERVVRQPVTLLLDHQVPKVAIDRSDEEGKWIQLSIDHDGLIHLTEDSPAFDVLKFYGKTHDEIREYVAGIEGVEDVTIRFRPAWSKVAPRVPEHIDVKVVSE